MILGIVVLRTGFMAFFSAAAFVVGVAVMVLLAEPPGVIVAVIVVVVAGVLLRTFVPSSLWDALWGRVKGRDDARRRRPTRPIPSPDRVL